MKTHSHCGAALCCWGRTTVVPGQIENSGHAILCVLLPTFYLLPVFPLYIALLSFLHSKVHPSHQFTSLLSEWDGKKESLALCIHC